MIRRYGPVGLAVAVVAALGLAHGRATDRWGTSDRLNEVVASMERVPDRFGDWTGPASPIDADVLKLGGIKGYAQRQYTSPSFPDPVSFLMVCGRGGPISVHTPDVCFGAQGFKQITEATPTTVEAGGKGHTFRVARFAEPGGRGVIHEVYWAWSEDGREWSAPDNPRLAFARKKAVYKMYLVRKILPGAKADAADPARAFLRTALPLVADALAPPAPTAPAE